ncbi:error-prone DNA polymerase [Paracoccus sp. S-4012]|uniref:error-prone DNA polymerase n=1 Tax=Paracoccus sp. S-4012 TaxID=2665648 RepID=UPI0012B06FD8|nr:error-prone DNA polymerase [Paracoccus sp. S-4012]MRX49771.1 error-prone DNA polymerase [Paracoccus sp. S-4012]
MTAYAELFTTSNFTFLTGASHPEELVTRAAELGLDAIAITDRNSLAGVVRAHAALRELARMRDEAGPGPRISGQRTLDNSARTVVEGATLATAAPVALPRLIVGARLVALDSPVEWLALPMDRAGYARLTQLLSLGKRRAPKGECHLRLAEIVSGTEGMQLIALPPDPLAPAGEAPKSFVRRIAAGPSDEDPDEPAPKKRTRSLAERRAEAAERRPAPEAGAVHDALARMAARHRSRLSLGAVPRWDGQDRARLRRLADLARETGLPMVAAGDVLMHRAARRALADVLSCMRLGCTVDSLGLHALPNAERRLKRGAEMLRVFAEYPEAVARTMAIARLCRFSLDELSYQYPDEVSAGEPAQIRLERLIAEAVRDPGRFPRGIAPDLQAKLDREVALIRDLNYAPYFLTVHDIMGFARSEGILCQGRGSAANSLVCYALGITEVPPGTTQMVFERFISKERGEPPDIDVDFEHERREEVIQHIYRTYGRHRAGLTATVIHFRTRAAVREVGKVMGLSDDTVAAIAGLGWGWGSAPPEPERIRSLGLDPEEPRLALTLRLIGEIIGFPRHLSQHVGGFVITQDRLDEICPIENAAMEDRTIIEWDKNDIDALGILKVDILGLGMLSALRKGFDLIASHGGPRYGIATVPREDPSVYEMLCRADAIGVFQVESRAQLNFLPRMQPREFYDLVIEVAIVRPGPIQGDMVHPYLARRQSREAVVIPSPELNEVLWRTKGIPLFQEQAMQIAVVGAGFDPGEADRLRRSLATFRKMGTIGGFRDRFMEGMLERGYDPAFATRCFDQIEGFGEYGFPESHAASFAILVYASAWMKRHHPAAFTCALLNSQPMGFYAPAQLVRDAREHGVEVRPVSIEASHWDCTLEPRPDGALALRLGFRLVKGLGQEDADWIVAARANGYPDVASVWRRAGVRPSVLERLAEADAFAALGLARRDALWQVRALGPKPLPLFADPIDGEAIPEPEVSLPAMSTGEQVLEDYLSTRLSLRAHPMAILRRPLTAEIGPMSPCAELARAPLRRHTITGLVITRQRPGTASGVIFLTLEDETGHANVIVWARVYQRFRAAVIGGRLLRVTGLLQREGIVTHLIAETVEDLSPQLGRLREGIDARADEGGVRKPPRGTRHPREQAKALFPSRDFH